MKNMSATKLMAKAIDMKFIDMQRSLLYYIHAMPSVQDMEIRLVFNPCLDAFNLYIIDELEQKKYCTVISFADVMNGNLQTIVDNAARRALDASNTMTYELI